MVVPIPGGDTVVLAAHRLGPVEHGQGRHHHLRILQDNHQVSNRSGSCRIIIRLATDSDPAG